MTKMPSQQELRPGQRITQVRNFAWLMIGIYQGRSVCLSRIAGKIPGRTSASSLVSPDQRDTERRLTELIHISFQSPSVNVQTFGGLANVYEKDLTSKFH